MREARDALPGSWPAGIAAKIDAPSEKTPLIEKPSTWGISLVALVRLVTCGTSIAEGYVLGIFSVTILPMIQEFELTPTEVSMLASLPMLIMIAVMPVAGCTMDKIGRKPIIALAYAMIAIGSLSLASARTWAGILVARVLQMTGCQIGVIATTVYMAEMAPSKSRGFLVSLEEIFINVGYLVAIGMGSVMVGSVDDAWRLIAAFGALLPLVCLSLLAFPAVPESARFLQLQGRTTEARALLQDILKDEPGEAEQTLRTWDEEEHTRLSAKVPVREAQPFVRAMAVLELFKLRPVSIACGVMVAKALAGHSQLASYIVVFMSRVTSESAAVRWAVVYQTMKVLALLPTCFIALDRFGRRTMLAASAAGCALAMAVAAIGFLTGFSFLVGAAFAAYAAAFSVGLGPVVWVYVAEIVPQEVRGTAMGLIGVPPRLLEFAFLSLMPFLVQQSFLPFAIFALLNASSLVFIFSQCPETKGLLLEDVKKAFV